MFPGSSRASQRENNGRAENHAKYKIRFILQTHLLDPAIAAGGRIHLNDWILLLKNDYDCFARLYDPVFALSLRSVRRAVLEELLPYKESRILDVCCGTGNQLKLLAGNGFNHLHCLDLSLAMLSVAQKSGDSVQIHYQDATRLAFAAESFDGVLISLALHEKGRADQEKLLAEIHRVLKPGGWFLAVDFALDEKTHAWSALAIRFVERLAGGEHYRHFKSYVQHGCLAGLIPPQRYELVKTRRQAMKGIALALYHKIS